MSIPSKAFSVERRIGRSWRIIHEVADDQAAAHLAQALVRQDPTEAVRICAPGGPGKDGAPARKVLWQHDGVPERDKQAEAKALGPIDAADLSRQAGVKSRSRLAGPERSARPGPDQSRPKQGSQKDRARAYLPILILGLLMVLATLALSVLDLSGLHGVLGRVVGPAAEGTGAEGPARPAPEVRDTPDKPNRFGRLVINLTQAAVARRYAYQSCIAENLQLGLVIVRRSYESQRISRSMLTFYETQLGEVLGDLNKGRDALLRAPAEKGGLPLDLVRFIDDWFRLERDMLETKRRFEQIVNPEDYCRAAADQADYLAAYYETKKRQGY